MRKHVKFVFYTVLTVICLCLSVALAACTGNDGGVGNPPDTVAPVLRMNGASDNTYAVTEIGRASCRERVFSTV